MICQKKSNYVESRWIWMQQLFGLDQKSWLKRIVIWCFIVSCEIVQQKCWNGSKINQNVTKCPLFDSIWQYLTLKKAFVSYAKWIGWPFSIQFGYRITTQIPIFLNNISQSNNSPKLSAYLIIDIDLHRL